MRRARRGHAASNGALNTDRLPPHAIEAEQGVVGCILLSPSECLGQCVEKFKAGAQVFYDLRHQTIWNVLIEMHDKQEAIDVITLQQRLKDRQVLEEIGGIQYLNDLMNCVPSAANLSMYLSDVHDKFLLRRLLHAAVSVSERIYEFQGEVPRLLDEVERDFSQLTESHAPQTEEHIKQVVRRVVTDLEQRHYTRGAMQLRGLPTGPAGNYLDKMIGGIRDSYYIVLAGRPGSGKTSLAMNLVEYLALDYVWREPTGEWVSNSPDEQIPKTLERKGIPIGVFSIEMDADCLVERLMFGRAGVDSAQFAQGFASKDAQQKLVLASAALAASHIYIDASPEQTIGQIAAKARRMVKQYGIKLFVLDYVQLVEQEGGNGFDRVREITKISRKIMALKKQLNVPWLVLAQMNRNIETAERHRKPVLSDLKDCGALEQDCDLAIFTYKTPREELQRGDPSDQEVLDDICGAHPDYKPGWSWANKPYRVDLVVPKYRFGPTGEAQMVFCKNLCRFEDWHLFKVHHKAEALKAGERKTVIDPEDVPE